MSVIIRGIKMPNDCPVCPLAHWNKLDNFTGCEVTKRYFSKEDMETAGRPKFCPLVELPPHGNLIDKDKLGLTDMEIILCQGDPLLLAKAIIDKVTHAPTIIKAEETE